MKNQRDYSSYLEQFCEEGHRRIGVFIWHETQRVPAESYVKANKKRNANVKIIVDMNPKIRTGQVYNGRMAIRYHHAGNSSGGGGR